MKLNYRDKVILIVLSVLLVLVGGFMLFVKPAMDDCNKASDELEAKKVELADLKEQNKKDANLKNEIKELKTKTNEVAANFYDYQIGYDANKTVYDLFGAEGVDIDASSMQISTYGSTVLSPYLYNTKLTWTDMDMSVDSYNEMNNKDAKAADKAAKNENAATATDPTAAASMAAIGCYQINVEFTSSYEGFKKFAQNITTTREKSMVIKSITIDDVNGMSEEEAGEEHEENVGKISGTMQLQMIVLKKIAD